MDTAVAQMVTNLLQAQPRFDKMRRAGVPPMSSTT
jgi:hypothetical protein